LGLFIIVHIVNIWGRLRDWDILLGGQVVIVKVDSWSLVIFLPNNRDWLVLSKLLGGFIPLIVLNLRAWFINFEIVLRFFIVIEEIDDWFFILGCVLVGV
jgi:hypothetical protein